MSTELHDIAIWLRAHPDEPDVSLHDLATLAGIAPERLRDRLRRLVEQGLLVQSEPLTGIADNDPRYRLAAR